MQRSLPHGGGLGVVDGVARGEQSRVVLGVAAKARARALVLALALGLGETGHWTGGNGALLI
jgi:hypothetical protein